MHTTNNFYTFVQMIDKAIALNKAFMAERDFLLKEYSASDLLEQFATVKIDVGRMTGKTTYIANHIIDDAIGVVSSISEKKYIQYIQPKAKIFTLDEFLSLSEVNASIVFIDTPSIVFGLKSKNDVTKKAAILGIKMMVLLGY